MAKRYYAPEDVLPEHAAQVFAFLNSVETPEEIDRAVEIPGEPDVGIILGRRLIETRDRLGGFTNLRQILDVPMIGPERFTEIVACLSDAPLPWGQPEPDDVMLELRALRAEVQRMKGVLVAAPRVRLRALQPSSYLGQALNIVVQVTEADGVRPRPDAAVTLVAIGGGLRTVDGSVVREGRSVTTRTDGVGMARAILQPETAEDLTPVQYASLQDTLRLLPPDAPTPAAAAAQIGELARQYRWDGNPFLREAVDVYFRDYGAGLLETVNAHDYLAAWRFVDMTVVAHLRDDTRPDADATTVDASAALTLRTRNWLAPWLEMMQQVAREQGRLSNDLSHAASSQVEDVVLGRVYNGIRDFLAEQRGVVGDYVGRRVAEESLREFAQSGIEQLPVEWQAGVLPALNVASHTVAAGGTPMLAVLGQTRTELRKEIDRRVPDLVGDLSGLVGDLRQQVEMFQGQLDQKADVLALDNLRTELQTSLDLKVDNSTFTGFQREVELNFQNRVTTDALNVFEQQMTGRIDTLSTNIGREVGDLRNSVTRIDGQVLDLRRGG